MRPRWHPSGGCARGVSAERFETPLAGGAAASMCASAFCWHTACQRRGGNPPAPAFPRRGKRERGSSNFLAAAGSSRWRSTNAGHVAGLLCARSSSTFLSITITKPIGRSARSAFPEVLLAPPTPLPCFYPHSHGPHWARCKLGSDLKPRSITTVTDLGCWVLPSCERSLKDQSYQTQSPEQGGECTKTSRGLLPFAPSTHVGYIPHLASRMRLLGKALPGWPASRPWPATLLPPSARHRVVAHILLR
jgi:hypothetical protein